jgi:ethanolamine utilization protein EutN
MQLARVIGTVVATMKSPNMEGVRLLIVQPLTRRLEPVGQPVVAADALETAGPGELVYIVGAREAAEAMPDRFVPVDHAIVGIADAVEELAGREGAGGPLEAGAPVEKPLGAIEPGRSSAKPRKPRGPGR